MSEQVMLYAGGQPDFLSLVNAEVEKVEPTIKVRRTPPDEEPPSLAFTESLPVTTVKAKEKLPLTAEDFNLITKAVKMLETTENKPEFQQMGRILTRVKKRLTAILNYG